MLYDLSRDIDVSRVQKRMSELLKKGALVELSEKREASLSQNAYLHLLLGYVAMEVGETLEYVKERYYKLECNRDLFVKEREDKIVGNTKYIRSTSELDSSEKSLSIERLRDWSSQTLSLYLPEPNEEGFLKEIKVELSRNKRFL